MGGARVGQNPGRFRAKPHDRPTDAFGPKGFNGIADLEARRKALGAIVGAGPKPDLTKIDIQVKHAPGLLKGDPDVEVRIITPLSLKGKKGSPCIYFIHGGLARTEADGGQTS